MTDLDPARLREVEREILSRRPEHNIDPTLDRIAALVTLLGDPQRAYPVIHVTGTNGKTSTARMTERLLRARGLRTGMFTSPHLSAIQERICIDGQPVDAEQFVAAYEEIQPYLDLVDEQQPARLSFFEVLTGMAFAIFADAPVDVAIIEVGLGGTWDSTNVAAGAVAVVTPISLDHTQYLGDTVEEIAADKSGIIKPGAIAVMAQQPPAVTEILLRRAARVGATVAREGLEFGVLSRELAVGGQQVVIRGLLGDYDGLFLPLFGAHQAGNLACAIAATEAFARADPVGSPGSDDADSGGSEATNAALAAVGLSVTSLEGAGLGGTGLSGAGLGEAGLAGIGLPGLPLSGTALGGAGLSGPGAKGAEVNGAEVNGAEINGAHVNGAEVNGAEVNGAPENGDDLAGRDTGGRGAGGRDDAAPGLPASARAEFDGRRFDELDGSSSGALDPELVREAVAAMSSPGRLEVLRRSPVVIADAAHNPAGMAATVAALEESFSFTELIAIVGISADKDVPGILDQLEPVASRLVVTRNSTERALDPDDLADLAEPVFGADRIDVAHRLDEAIEIGVGLADEADASGDRGPDGLGGAIVLITGSVFTAGEARQLLRPAARPARPARPGPRGDGGSLSGDGS